MGLFDQLQAYIDANTPRNTRKPVNAATVIDQGLLGGRIGQVPQRAKEMYRGLLKAPAELAALGSPAMRSQVDQAMTKPHPIDKDKAMQMAMDTLQTTSPVGGLAGMFIGKGAKTWDAIAAQKADDLLKQGIDPRDVWKQTGTLKGVDGALRQEIPDNLARAKPMDEWSWGNRETVKSGDSTTSAAGEFLQHDALQGAYPDGMLDFGDANRRLTMTVKPSMSGGSYDNEYNIALGMDGNAINKSTGLHELQHAIQQREGWARGGSPNTAMEVRPLADIVGASSKLQDKIIALKQTGATVDPETGLSLQAMESNLNSLSEQYKEAQSFFSKHGEITPHEADRRLAGEAEARLTQSRMGLDAAQRLQHYPYDQGQYGLDVPLDSLIVRGLLGQ